MKPTSDKQMLKRARFTLCALAALLLPFSISFAQHRESNDPPSPPGRLVDAGGHLLHIQCSGEGAPTVLMEAGAGDFSLDWGLVLPLTSKHTRVCAYDRAGYAWSDPGPAPRTMRQIVFELHTALLNGNIDGPYILVGQSLGGLIVRTYAADYPKEVAGVILVDSSHEDMLISLTDRATGKENVVRFRELSRAREIPSVTEAMPGAAKSNLPPQAQPQTSIQTKLDSPYDKLPANLRKLRLWAMSQPNYGPARSSEFDFLPEEMTRMYAGRSKNKYPLGDTPLIVLTGGNRSTGGGGPVKKQLDESHDRLQADLVTLSTNSKQIIAKFGGHHIQLDEPELVADAIRQQVDAFRRHTRRLK